VLAGMERGFPMVTVFAWQAAGAADDWQTQE
jgi:hypothetical protein